MVLGFSLFKESPFNYFKKEWEVLRNGKKWKIESEDVENGIVNKINEKTCNIAKRSKRNEQKAVKWYENKENRREKLCT